MLLEKGKQIECDETISEIMKNIQAKIDELTAGSKAGWQIDMPGWNAWYGTTPDYRTPVGAWTRLRMTIHGDLDSS